VSENHYNQWFVTIAAWDLGKEHLAEHINIVIEG
jgi:hypothetical protein